MVPAEQHRTETAAVSFAFGIYRRSRSVRRVVHNTVTLRVVECERQGGGDQGAQGIARHRMTWQGMWFAAGARDGAAVIWTAGQERTPFV